MSPCYSCGDSCDTDLLPCVSCCNTLHYGCIHTAGILTSSWNTSKPTPKYSIYIFECDNFSCKSCNFNKKNLYHLLNYLNKLKTLMIF